jgi:hypothetical protein
MRRDAADAYPRVFGEDVEQYREFLPHDALPVHAGIELQVDVESTLSPPREFTNHSYLFGADQQGRQLVGQEEGNVRVGDRPKHEDGAGDLGGTQRYRFADSLNTQNVDTGVEEEAGCFP